MATPPPTPASASQTPASSASAQWSGEGYIFSASVAQLAQNSPEQSLQEIQRRTTSTNWFIVYAVATVVLLLVIVIAAPGWVVIVCAPIAIIGGVAMYAWDREERTARLLYDVDDPEILERMAMIAGAGEWLSRANRLWHVYYSARTGDWKHNAGASTLIQRTPTSCMPGALPRIELNIEPWCIPVGPQRLLFLPDRLLVLAGNQLAGVPYEHLSATCEHKRFIEEEYQPPDAPLIEYTWRYPKKSGGPDLRFANNRQLPVLDYGRIELRSASGVHVVLQTSNPACADGATRALAALIARATSVQSAPASNSAPQSQQPVPVRPDSPRSTSALVDRHRMALALGLGGLVVLSMGAMSGIVCAVADDAPAPGRRPPSTKVKPAPKAPR